MGRISSKLRSVADGAGNRVGYAHRCPGCEHMHVIYTENYRVTWKFNGNLESPTFDPSVKHTWGRYADPNHVDEGPGESGVCHYFIRNGNIEFCNDCTHRLNGQTVALPDLPLEN